MMIQLAGCVILDSQNKMYLLHRNKKGVTQWELPGGKVESEETAEQAAAREIVEELGVHVKIHSMLGQTQFTENDIDFEYTWFLAEVISGEMMIAEPQTFDGLQSYSTHELADLQLSNNMKKLSEALKSGEVTIFGSSSRPSREH